MLTRWWLALIWMAFAARLMFYATALPLWEGFDEWAHFAVIRHMAINGEVLVPRNATLPLDVAASLRLAPMPPTLRDLPGGAISHEAFWALPPQERLARETAFRAIPPDYARQSSQIQAYEALQPPVYYWLMTPALWLTRTCGLATQVFFLRWMAILVGSLVIPLVFLVARAVLVEDRLALGCAAIVALMPEMAINLARVGNECLAVVLYTAVIWFAVRRRSGLALGVLLGLGLITKAYFLAAVAGVALVLGAPRSLALAVGISGWWYVRNLWTTGTLSGLSESVMLRATDRSTMLHDVVVLSWRTAIDSILFSHLYFGGWSGLTVRSWMYHLLYLFIAVAVLGLIRLWRRPEIRSLAAMYGAFWLAQLYNVVLIYLTKGVPTSMGWYMYAVIGAEVTLTIAGLRQILGRWAIAVGTVLFGALDLYTMNAVALPYYTGMIGRKPNGALAALHLSELRVGELFQRLTVFKPPMVTEASMVALWMLYVLATVGLMASGVLLARGVNKG